MNYTIDKPYPKISVLQPNVSYGRMILDNVGGMDSEMSAISLYLYNHTVIDPIYVSLKEAFEKISIVEMHHLNIFCELSYQLGMEPRLWTSADDYNEYWSPSYNNYLSQLDVLLENAIMSEKRAIEKYAYQASIINDPTIVAILNRIILDEELHVQILEYFYQMLC